MYVMVLLPTTPYKCHYLSIVQCIGYIITWHMARMQHLGHTYMKRQTDKSLLVYNSFSNLFTLQVV